MIKSFFKNNLLFVPKSYCQPITIYNFSNDGKFSFREAQEEENANPFYNPRAASIKSDMDFMRDQIKQWQADFKEKHGRKPNFEEMKEDPIIGPHFQALEKQKEALKVTVNRFRIN